VVDPSVLRDIATASERQKGNSTCIVSLYTLPHDAPKEDSKAVCEDQREFQDPPTKLDGQECDDQGGPGKAGDMTCVLVLVVIDRAAVHNCGRQYPGCCRRFRVSRRYIVRDDDYITTLVCSNRKSFANRPRLTGRVLTRGCISSECLSWAEFSARGPLRGFHCEYCWWGGGRSKGDE
jgi:hypothetical protein